MTNIRDISRSDREMAEDRRLSVRTALLLFPKQRHHCTKGTSPLSIRLWFLGIKSPPPSPSSCQCSSTTLSAQYSVTDNCRKKKNSCRQPVHSAQIYIYILIVLIYSSSLVQRIIRLVLTDWLTSGVYYTLPSTTCPSPSFPLLQKFCFYDDDRNFLDWRRRRIRNSCFYLSPEVYCKLCVCSKGGRAPPPSLSLYGLWLAKLFSKIFHSSRCESLFCFQVMIVWFE